MKSILGLRHVHTVLVAMLLLAPITAGSANMTRSDAGEALIDCWFAVSDRVAGRCTPLSEGMATIELAAPTGSSRISFTLEWEPVSSDAGTLRLMLFACGADSQDCIYHAVVGQSPLTLDVEDERLSGRDMQLGVDAPLGCRPSELPTCTTPLAKLINNQPLHYSWTIA